MTKKTKLKIIWKSFILRIFLFLFILTLAYGGFIGYKLYKMEGKIVEIAQNDAGDSIETRGFIETAKTLITNNRIPLRGDDDGRTNILLLGMSGEGYKSQHLTDTIMMVSVNTNNYKSAMLSVPRDLYTKIPKTNGLHTKINAIYTFSIKNKSLSSSESMSNIKTVMENITGQEIHYYLTLDFMGFKNIIKELGGVDVEVKNDIYDSSYPGPNYSYETFELKKGFQHLDSETALKYARVRHIKGGDFGRASRQQEVLAAAKKKAFSLETIVNPVKISSLIDTLGDHIKTDIQLAEIPSFIDLARKVNVYQMTSKVLDAWSSDSLLGSTHVEMGGVMAYVLVPKANNYKQIHELSENIFDLEKIKRKETAIKKEDAKIAVVLENKKDYHKIKVALNNFGYHTTINPTGEDLPVCPKENTILNISKERKIFTLDDLAAKLNAKIEYRSPEEDSSEAPMETSQLQKFDIVACLSNDILTYFEMQNEKEEDSPKEIRDRSIINEDGNVLFKKE
ncbi:hypothetical protein HOB25_01700 [bacterium]|jgi:polyisoprenyl-teichoic acid--peptidoglycan teichoic acid transferase|nr:hypothetical protein [bacterium]